MDNHLRVLASSVSHSTIKYKCPYFPHLCRKQYHSHGNNMKSLKNKTTHRIINGCCGQSAHSGVFITINDDTQKIKKRKRSSV